MSKLLPYFEDRSSIYERHYIFDLYTLNMEYNYPNIYKDIKINDKFNDFKGFCVTVSGYHVCFDKYRIRIRLKMLNIVEDIDQ